MNASVEWSPTRVDERNCEIWQHWSNESLYDAATYQTAARLCRVNRMIWDVAPVVYLLVGTVGNLVSAVIWSERRLAQQTQWMSVVLVSLAVSDTCVLYTGLLLHYMRKSSYIGWHVQNANAAVCKLHEFLVYFSLSVSAWLVAFVSLERCVTLVLSNPHWRSAHTNRFAGRCVRRPAFLWLAVAVVVLLCGCVNAHIFWTREFRHEQCKYDRHSYGRFLDHVWPKVDLTFAALVPVAVVLLSTSAIALSLYCSNARSLLARKSQAPSSHSDCVGGQRKARPQSLVARKTSKITCTLVCVSLCYTVCSCPAKVYLVLFPGVTPPGLAPSDFFKFRLAWTCVLTLQYLTNVVNFLIYSVANSLFRKQLQRMLASLQCFTKLCPSINN